MEKQILSDRLRQVASFVPNGARLLDVGSDHAYLPIDLTQQGVLTYAIAGEVVQGPYQSAQKNVTAHGLSQQIEVRLANGLAAVELVDQIDTIVIAGMGGRLIAAILEAGKDKLEQVTRLILQPNNREDDVRIWLEQNAFSILEEAILEENGKYYEIIVAVPGQMTLTEKEKRFGPCLSLERSAVFVERWERELLKLDQALAKIPEHRSEERLAIIHKQEAIQEVLHES